MCFSVTTQNGQLGKAPSAKTRVLHNDNEEYLDCEPILPGLPDDVAKYCLALVPRTYFPVMGSVSKPWREYVRSSELTTVRRQAGKLEEWLYVLTGDEEGKGSHWEILEDSSSCEGLGDKRRVVPEMPGPMKAGFGVVVVDSKMLVIGGYSVGTDYETVCDDVYQYDSRLNSWSKLAKLNVARRDFACAEVNGQVYAVGGYGPTGTSLSSAEVYDPCTNTWTPIPSLRRPRWGCFACNLSGKLYVMGGRSSFTIGHSRAIDIYNPDSSSWAEEAKNKNGCVMVTAHAVLGDRLFCMEWKDQRKLSVFDPVVNERKGVTVPVAGSCGSVGFRFGVFGGKLLLFGLKKEDGCRTLVYDPWAVQGKEWGTVEMEPSGACLCSITIKA